MFNFLRNLPKQPSAHEILEHNAREKENEKLDKLIKLKTEFYDNCVSWSELYPYVKNRLDKEYTNINNRVRSRIYNSSLSLDDFKERLDFDIEKEQDKCEMIIKSITNYLETLYAKEKLLIKKEDIEQSAKEMFNNLDTYMLMFYNDKFNCGGRSYKPRNT